MSGFARSRHSRLCEDRARSAARAADQGRPLIVESGPWFIRPLRPEASHKAARFTRREGSPGADVTCSRGCSPFLLAKTYQSMVDLLGWKSAARMCEKLAQATMKTLKCDMIAVSHLIDQP